MNNKIQANHRISVAYFCVLLCVIVVAGLLSGCSGFQENPVEETVLDASVNDIYTEPPVLPPVEVVMDGYSFTYSGEKGAVILTEETDDGLAFFAGLKQEKVPVFTLVFNSQEGDIVTMLTAESGEQTPVSFMMYEMPGELSEEDAQSFMLAQEAVNEIVESIKLR